MYFAKSQHIIYRDYPEFGYLTDNRNFGYDTASKSCRKIGERILSKVGSMFYSVLTEHPQTIEKISQKLSCIFTDVPLLRLENNAKEFLTELSKDGFVRLLENETWSSEDKWFSYENVEKNLIEDDIYDSDKDNFDSHWFDAYRLTRLHLSVSGACNEHCIHCYFPKHLKKGIMQKELFLQLLAQCKEMNVINLTISGGEPMMNPNLLFFIRKCRENNFSINVLSNLTFLTEDIVEEFKITPLLSVQTSLYSLDENIHDSITGIKGSCRKTKKAIEILRNLNIPMQINCPIMKQNKDSYQEVLIWAKSLNIEASSDYMLFGCYDGSRENLHCRLELSEIETIIREHKEHQLDDNSLKSEVLSWSSICPVCYSSLCISPLGKVYPCEGWQSFLLGDISDTSLRDIWENSPGIKALRALTLEDFPKCVACNDREFCSICLIRNVNESNRLNCKDINPYFCSIAKMKRNIVNK